MPMLVAGMVTMHEVQSETVAVGGFPPAPVTSCSVPCSPEKSSLRILELLHSMSFAAELAEAVTKFHSGLSGQFVFELFLIELFSEDPNRVSVNL